MALLLAIGFGFLPLLRAADPAPASKTTYFNGKVVPLQTILEKQGAKLDKEADAQWLALVTEDGKIYPLVKDAGCRMFFTDTTLQNRPMRLTGRLIGETNFLQVFQVHSYLKGELHELYYWCDICAIKRFEKRDCECCGGPMELREEKIKK